MLHSLLKYSFSHRNKVRTRFAPSPTGHLHLGHLYAAVIAHDLAIRLDGEYLLRFEDIDITRVRDKYYHSILEDLHFFELKHHTAPISQLAEERSLAYASALNKLEHLGVTYPCFCTRKEISTELMSITNAPHKKDYQTQHYPGICKKLSSEKILEHLNAGKTPAIRLDADKAKALTGELSFKDLRHGSQSVDHHILGDCILARKDIGTSYHIASVVDDNHQEISHVTRGDDLLESTHLHRILQSLLGFHEPIYLHHPLVVNTKNERLSKRAESISIKSLQKSGHTKLSLLEMIKLQLEK